MDDWWQWLLCLAGAYGVGSVSFALILASAKGVDLRKVGSGNLGATNLGRTLGKRWGIRCFVLDMLKGLVPVVLAGWWMGWLSAESMNSWERLAWPAVAIAAVAGHMFPFYLGFKGGKGVSTSLGGLLGLFPTFTLAALAGGVVWLVVFKWKRFVSLASMVAAAVLPPAVAVVEIVRGQPVEGWSISVGVAVVLAAAVILKHRDNIKRLLAGTELPAGKRASEPE